MKSLFNKIASFTMALVVLFSTFSFTVAQHYCGDNLVDFSFFGQVESCGMEIRQTQNSHNDNFDSNDCCDDVTFSKNGQHDLKLTFEKLSFEQQHFVASFVYSYLNLFEGLQENVVPFSCYSSLLFVKDIHILDQIFLI